MTKTNNRHRTPIYRRPIIWVLVVIGILIIIALVVIFTHHNQSTISSSPSSDQPAASTPQPDSTPTPESSGNQSTPASANEPDPKTTQYEGENPNDAQDLTGVITYKGVDNSILYIAVTIDQYLSQNGTCQLTLTGKNTSRTLTASTPAIADVQSSVCQTFEVSTAGLPRDTYTIEIKLNSNDKTGSIRDEVSL